MSAEIINLRQARKHKARAAADATAARNRTAFGLTKSERSAAKASEAKAIRQLDGHKLAKPKPDDA